VISCCCLNCANCCFIKSSIIFYCAVVTMICMSDITVLVSLDTLLLEVMLLVGAIDWFSVVVFWVLTLSLSIAGNYSLSSRSKWICVVAECHALVLSLRVLDLASMRARSATSLSTHCWTPPPVSCRRCTFASLGLGCYWRLKYASYMVAFSCSRKLFWKNIVRASLADSLKNKIKK
jgi:hypothetical protein